MPGPPFTQSAASLWASDNPISCQTPSRPLEDSLLVTSHAHLSLLHPPVGLVAWALQPVASTPPIRTHFPKHQPGGTHSHRVLHTGIPTPTASHRHLSQPDHHSLSQGSWDQEAPNPTVRIPPWNLAPFCWREPTACTGTVKSLTSISSLNP